MTLNDIPFKQQCHVIDIRIKDKTKRQRLLDLGFCYYDVTKCRLAPLGDPMVVQVNNTYIAIRSDDAEKIEVVPL